MITGASDFLTVNAVLSDAKYISITERNYCINSV